MGAYFCKLLRCCFGREETTNLEYITPKPNNTQRDIEPDTSKLYYSSDNYYDMINSKYSTLDDHELNIRIKYYVLMNGKRIDMI